MKYTPRLLERRIPEPSVSATTTHDNIKWRDLHLAFLGCEANPPYGPYDHTANLFLELLSRSISESGRNGRGNIGIHLRISIFETSKGHFPDSIDQYDGVILPGSFSSAYDQDSWILDLSKFIQSQLIPAAKPTLGVCFGHQILAQSYLGNGGAAIKCPAGPQAGRKTFQSTPVGRSIFGENSLDLLYTHGDMVESLPPTALSLGGNSSVPIESAIYFETPEQLQQFQVSASTMDSEMNTMVKPIAITFQAHPEYAHPELGLQQTLNKIVDAMQDRDDITKEEQLRVKVDAKERFASVQQQSINAMIRAGELLGWF